MAFEITKAGAKFTRRGRPDKRCRESVKAIVELGCAHPQRAQVVAEHGDVVQSVRDFPPGPHAGGVRRAEKFVGDQACIHAQPEWEVALHAPRPR